MGDKYRDDTQRIQEEKMALYPLFSVSLNGLDVLPLNGSLRFKATLKYESMPGSSDQPIVARIHNFGGPIGDHPIYWGQYQIFTSNECVDSNKVQFNYKNVAMRKPRDPKTGRFLDLPAEAFEYEINEESGWVEMRPGQEISRELNLRLDADPFWKKCLKKPGGPYWLSYSPSGTVGNPRGIEKWRFGTLEEWRGTKCDTRQDDGTALSIQVEAKNALKFWVTDETA